MIKKWTYLFVTVMFLFTNLFSVNVIAEGEAYDLSQLTSQSAIVMEASTGTILYENNAHEPLRPASVTKIMTLLIIYEAVFQGQISWDDEVVVSQHASSMGGSQVYLAENEIQTVETMTKCIAVASANDAAVAMAEFIGGSEGAFVELMNQKAQELGMKDTHFVNPSGLDVDGHLTSAYDIALMSRELTTRFPEVFDLTTIWMDTIIHKTNRGEEEFGLTNTNKLLQWYEGATGLKTGSTDKAKYCLSGTASRNGIDLIAVVMAAPDYKIRFQEVMRLLDYGFATCRIYEDPLTDKMIQTLPVAKGQKETVDIVAQKDFTAVLAKVGFSEDKLKKTVHIPESLEAPIQKDMIIGEIVYTYDGEEIGRVDLITADFVDYADYKYYLKQLFLKYFKC